MPPKKLSNPGKDDKPLWLHVEVLDVPIGGGGNRKWRCKYCNKIVTGSYSKVKGHLLKIPNMGVEPCKGISDDVFRQIDAEHKNAEEKSAKEAMNAKQRRQFMAYEGGSDLAQPKRKKGALELAFSAADREEVDRDCAMMFYTGGLSFNFARNFFFRRYSTRLANSNLAGYVPPAYDRLRTTLLSQQKQHVGRLMQPIKDSWKKKGASLCSDGWSDNQRVLINIMVASAAGPMFLKSIDASHDVKDAEYIAKVFMEAVEEIGPGNIVQIVTDNGSNFKAAGALIESKYPRIFWTPCVVHCLNLAIKSICDPNEKSDEYAQCQWIKDLVTQAHDINYFILNHSLPRTIFSRYSNLKLLKVAETRFASNIVMLTRIRRVRDVLEKTVMDPDWKKIRGNLRNAIELKSRDIKDTLVSDTWWDKIDYFLKFTEPIMWFLRVADSDSCVLHLVYDMWDMMIEHVKSCIFEQENEDLLTGRSVFFDAIQKILEDRWNKSNTPLHCLAHSLVPKYYSQQWLEGGGRGVHRLAPNEDDEISLNREMCFRRIFDNPEDLKKVTKEYGAFACDLDYFGQPHVMASRGEEDPLSWWANYGSFTPLLQGLAFRLLSQPASSSCCERNWSTYGGILNAKRNRLTSQRTEDLVYVHNNMRLYSRKQPEYTSGPCRFWDIGRDTPDGDSILEIGDLSLNDPEIEAVTFDVES